jgi:hypothetical protein
MVGVRDTLIYSPPQPNVDSAFGIMGPSPTAGRIAMQTSFSELEYASKKKRTRRDRFLGDLEQLVPWVALIEALEPHYPKSGKRGRPPIGLERMLRLYIAQLNRPGYCGGSNT